MYYDGSGEWRLGAAGDERGEEKMRDDAEVSEGLHIAWEWGDVVCVRRVKGGHSFG